MNLDYVQYEVVANVARITTNVLNRFVDPAPFEIPTDPSTS